MQNNQDLQASNYTVIKVGDLSHLSSLKSSFTLSSIDGSFICSSLKPQIIGVGVFPIFFFFF